MSPARTLALVFNLFAGLGLAFLVGAGYAWRSTARFTATAVHAEGVVVGNSGASGRHGRSLRPVVRFVDAQGQQHVFTSRIGSSPARYSVGQRAPVLYPSGLPEEADTDDFLSLYLLPTLLAGLGTMFFGLGGGFWWYRRRRRLMDLDLKEHGRPITAELRGAERDRSLSVNGENPFVVVAQWQDPATTKVHVFKSEQLWYDPTSLMTNKTVRVFIAENDPSRYYVDLSFLPERAEA